jgi:hypothetical protein
MYTNHIILDTPIDLLFSFENIKTKLFVITHIQEYRMFGKLFALFGYGSPVFLHPTRLSTPLIIRCTEIIAVQNA